MYLKIYLVDGGASEPRRLGAPSLPPPPLGTAGPGLGPHGDDGEVVVVSSRCNSDNLFFC